MSANPSRWPRDTASRAAAPPVTTQFLPTLPLELAPLPAAAAPARQRAASVREIWHDTHPQADPDEEDTQPGVFDALAPRTGAARPAPSPGPTPTRSLDPADPLAGRFDEAVSGLQVRELDDDQLFQRLFGTPG